MTGTPFPKRVTIQAIDRADMDHQIENAISLLLERAAVLGDRGILLSRHSATEVTAELDDQVPYGITREMQYW